MRKVRILSGLLVAVLIMVMASSSVLAVSGEKEVLSNIPYDYMTNMKIRSFDNYENLSTGDKKLVYTIPDGVAETLTTEALLETILNNEYFPDLLGYNSFVEGVKTREEQFRIIEFLERKDSLRVLEKYIGIYSKTLIEKEKQLGFSIEDVLVEDEVENFPYDYLLNYLQVYFMQHLVEDYGEILNNNIINQNIQSRFETSTVRTKGNQVVNCLKNRTWDDSDETYAGMVAALGYYYVRYPNNQKIGDISPVYNCHSYAWHDDSTSNIYWIQGQNELNKYLSEATSGTNNVIVGTTKVLYYSTNLTTPNNISHSSHVFTLKSNGDVETVVSKWGDNALFIHSIEDTIYYYADRPISYRNY